MINSIVLGVDIGTSDSKVLAALPSGQQIALVSGTTDWAVRPGGLTDTEPDSLVAVIIDLLAQAADAATVAVGPLQVVGIGITGMAESGVLIDQHGKSEHPVIAWFDPRGADELAAFPAQLRSEFPGRTGLPVTPLATVAKLAWMTSQGTVLADKCWLNLPEYVAYQLTGVLASEPSLVARTGLFDQSTGDLWPEMLAYLGASRSLIPSSRIAGESWGVVSGDMPQSLRGAVVTVAGHDHPVAAVGCGVLGDDTIFDDLGTAEAFVRTTDIELDRSTRAELATTGFNVVTHVLAGRTLLVVGTRGGLILRRTLALLGVSTESARTRLDAQARDLVEAGRVADVVSVSGAANDDGVLSITAAADVSPAQLWLAAVDHTIAEAARLLEIMSAQIGPATSSVVAGGWTRMESIRAAKIAALPAIRFSTQSQAGAYGAAAFAAHAANAYTADASSQLRPDSIDSIRQGPTRGFLASFTGASYDDTDSPYGHSDHQEVSV